MKTTRRERIGLGVALIELAWLVAARLLPDPAAVTSGALLLPVGPLPSRTSAGAALREAREYRTRAKLAVSQERDALERWDPEAAARTDAESWRLELLAADPNLARARAAAERAAALAQTTDEASRAAELLSLIEHEAGYHQAELHWARELVRLEPGSERARMVLQRALRCSECQQNPSLRSIATAADQCPAPKAPQSAPGTHEVGGDFVSL